jgi:serine/threonine protein kinase
MPNPEDNDEQVMQLLELTLAKPRELREGFLHEACSGDAELYEQVWRYVEWQECMGSFLDMPLFRPMGVEHPFNEGDILEGRFRIQREVARGGMGIVYEALDQKLGKRVALKCARNGFRQRLPPEVRHAQEISHPNVCRIFEIHTATVGGREVDFITMEFLEGPTLADRLRDGALPRGEAAVIAMQICAGLAEAHRRNVIHGDLKSCNVVLTGLSGELRAVITDFGMARDGKTARPSAQSGDTGGTPDYMAPELLRGEKATAASDVYALGILLFELATGNRPHDSGVPVEQHHTGRLLAAFPKWGPILAGCLHADPARRYQSAVEVTAALAQPSRRWFLWIAGASGAAAAAATAWTYIRPKRMSVAVLPFINVRGKPGTEYLSDGISESVIRALAQLPDIKVIARSSSFRFSSENTDTKKITQTLGVRCLVTGRVEEVNGKLKITAELVSEDGSVIWGSEYLPGPANLSELQAQIAAEIAQHVRSRLSAAEQSKLAKSARVNPAAFALLLRGKFQMQFYNPASTQKAAAYFEQALAIDPGYALASAELANTYRRLGGAGILEPARTLALSEAATRRALAADGDLAEAHAVLADIKRDQWDWNGAEREYLRALDLTPGLVPAREGLAICLSLTGQSERAIAETRRVGEMDPISLSNAIDSAAVYYNLHRYDQALATLNQAVQWDPMAPALWTWVGIVSGGKSDFAGAIEAFEKAMRFGDQTAATQCYYIFSLARSGRKSQAQKLLDALLKDGSFVPPSSQAIALTGLGQDDRALELLEKSYAARDPLLQYIAVESHFNALHGTPRFRSLVAKLGLPIPAKNRQEVS